jgi:hypothetical protein
MFWLLTHCGIAKSAGYKLFLMSFFKIDCTQMLLYIERELNMREFQRLIVRYY